MNHNCSNIIKLVMSNICQIYKVLFVSGSRKCVTYAEFFTAVQSLFQQATRAKTVKTLCTVSSQLLENKPTLLF